MKWSFLLFSSFLCLQAIAQYPATGNKMRLGWQTTGDGLVYRGAIGDTATLDPSGINNAWMLLDTANGNLYAYRAKAWRLVSGGGGGGGLTMPFDSVTFNVNETDASLRELKYSEEKGYLQYGGQDSVQIPLLPGIWYVRNDTSVTIPKGTVLRATGTLGASGRIKVKHMIANGSIDAMYILGIAMQDIAVGADGYVMTQGKIRQVNTQAYSEGAVLYADVDTLGGLTQTEPTGSNLKLPIAFVVNSASNGTIAVRVTSGAYMRDLHDAEITSPDSSASLYYNKSEGIWRDTGAAVLVADTAAMLTNYINVVDTAAMLTNYINIADTATMLSSYISNADTSVFARDFQISGTTNRLAMFTGANTVGNSNVYQDSTGKIGIGINPSYKFQMFFNNSVTGVQDTLMDLYSANWYPVGVRSRVSNQIANGSYAVIGEALNGHYQENVGVYGIATKSDISGPGVNIGVKGEVSGTYNALSTALGATYGGLFINNVRKTLSSGNFNIGLRVITDSAGTYGIYQNGFGVNYFQGNVGIGTSSPSRPLHVNANSSMIIPSGETGTRPAPGAEGDIRFNSTVGIKNLEWYNGTAWREPVNAARSPAAGLANRFAKFDANGLLDTSAVLTQSNGRIGINATPTEQLQVGGTVRATRFNVNTFLTQVLSINNYAPAGAIGENVYIGDGGASSTYTSGNDGSYNVGIGGGSLKAITRGWGNVGVGALTLGKTTTGTQNAAIGGGALQNNTTGKDNLAFGADVLANNTSGEFNTGVGRGALVFNKTGNYNIAIGSNSLFSNDNGNYNVAIGGQAMYLNQSGTYNITFGVNALYGNTTGSGNIALGNEAGYRISGGTNNQTGSNSIFIGADTRASAAGGSNEIVIGYQAIGNGSNTTTIGNSSTTATILQYGETRLGMAVDSGAYTLQVNGDTKLIGNLARKKPVTIAAATYTVLSDDSWLICNHTAQITITLPTAANSIGRELMIKYVAGGGATVISNATNVSPIVGGALTNIILPATAGSWVTLVCDGANWIIMQKG